MNFENTAGLFILKSLNRMLRVATGRFKAPDGIKITTDEFPSFDNENIPFYLVEPYSLSDKLPVIMYLHGGAFVVSIQPMMLRNAAYYAEKLGCRIFIPEYRLSYEHPYPVPFEDCYSALLHLHNNENRYKIDRNRLILYGESSGGCLAASAVQRAKDIGGPRAAGQMLIYPVIDSSMNYQSMEKYEYAVWPKKANKHMWNLYLKDRNQDMRYAVPAKYEDPSGLPTAYIEPQEMDILCDEAVAYGEKLQNAGVETEINLVKASYHAFDMDHKSPLVQRVLEHRVAVMKRMLGI